LTFYVVDPAAPSTPKFSTALAPLAGGVVSQSVITAWDGTWSMSPGPTVNIHGSSHAYYVQNGKVFDISLRKSDAQTPKQLSSLSGACGVVFRWQLESTGNDTWVQVAATTGAVACSTTAYVRSTMNGTQSAVVLPAGVTLLAPLYDPTVATTTGFLMRDGSGATPKLSVYDANLQPVGDVTGGAGTNDVSLIYFEASGQGMYLKVDNTLRRLTWSGNSATLSGNLYTFTGGLPASPATADSAAVYFADGSALVRVAGGNPATPLTNIAPQTIFGVSTTANNVVILAANPNGSFVLETDPKTGGTAVTLANATSLNGVLPVMIGARGDQVFYAKPVPFNPLVQSGSAQLRRVDASGQNDTLLVDNTFAIPVTNSTVVFDLPVAASALVCPPTTSTTCALGQYDFASGTTLPLGTLATANPNTFFIQPTGTGGTFSGVPGWLSVQGTAGGITSQDMYVITPGTQNSLGRVTTNVP